MRCRCLSWLRGLVHVCLLLLMVSCGGGRGGAETAVSPPPTTPVTPPTTPVGPGEPPAATPPATPPPTTPAEPQPSASVRGTLSLVAGSLDTSQSGQGSADGFYDAVRFSNPAGLVYSGGSLFVADLGNNTIRRISPIGDVTTYAGVPGPSCIDGTNGGGTCLDSSPGVTATFSFPTGLAADADGVLYVTDGLPWLGVYLQAVRLIDTNGQVSTFKLPLRRPPEIGPYFAELGGIVVDADRNFYVRSQSPDGISRFAPDGSSQLVAAIPCSSSYALARDATGNLYVSNINSIEKVTPNGEMVHLAGPQYPAGCIYGLLAGSADGLGTAARFDIANPGSIRPRGSFAVDSHGNLYVSDINNHTIRKVTPEGLVTTIAGKAGVAGMQLGPLPGLLTHPAGLALQGDNTLFVASGNAILRITLH